MCMALEYYLGTSPKESSDKHEEEFRTLGGDKVTFPVASIGDLTVFFNIMFRLKMLTKSGKHEKRGWI